MRDAEQLRDVSQDLVARYTMEPVYLQRAEAEFYTEKDGDKLVTTITVPIDGDVRLLEFAPDADRIERPFAVVSSPYETHQRIAFTRGFPASVDPDLVRDWAKGEVDKLEIVLSQQQAEITSHNVLVATVAREEVSAQEQLLKTLARAAAELDGKRGI